MDFQKNDGVQEFSPVVSDEHALPCASIGHSKGDPHVVISMPDGEIQDLPTMDEAERDIDVMVASLGLQSIRRYMNQHHWYEESRLARAADEAEPGLKLENVAAHSWHVADAVLLLAPIFPEIGARRALELAILHDKLELLTGDFDPVGPAGDGSNEILDQSFPPIQRAVLQLIDPWWTHGNRQCGSLTFPLSSKPTCFLLVLGQNRYS